MILGFELSDIVCFFVEAGSLQLRVNLLVWHPVADHRNSRRRPKEVAEALNRALNFFDRIVV